MTPVGPDSILPAATTGPGTAGRGPSAAGWEELLHDWQTRSEHDGGYSLLRCRVCGTEVVR